MSVGTPQVLDTIRTAAADCDAIGNTMARNELLDAAVIVRDLLAALEDVTEAYASLLKSDYETSSNPDPAADDPNVKFALEVIERAYG